MESHQEMHDTSHNSNTEDHPSKSGQEKNNASASSRSRSEDAPVTSNKEPSKKPIRIRIIPPRNTSQHEEEESTNPVSSSNEQSKSSGSSRFESKSSRSASNSVEMELDPEEVINDLSTSESEETDTQSDNNESVKTPTCNLCGRSCFQSYKALYEHMRSHSDKEAKKEVNDERWYPNLKWKITGKRGRDGKEQHDPENVASSSTREDKSSMDQIPGLEITIRFKNVPENDAKLLAGINEEIMENIFDMTGDDTEKMRISTTQEKENCIANMNLNLRLGLGDDGEPKGKRIKSEGSHVCHICNKSFPTHQALGGHTASHNKGKCKQGEGGERTLKKRKKKAGDNEHRCKKCGSVYATGQSLGGHMRKHYEPEEDKNSGSWPSRSVREDSGKCFDESFSENAMEVKEQSESVKEDTGEVFRESVSANAFEETEQSETVKKYTSEVFGESVSANAVEETEQSETVKKDTGEVFGESVSANVREESEPNYTRSASVPSLDFDLNEMPRCED